MGLEHAAALPKSVDLRPLMPPIVDQLSLGSCTGNAIAGMLGFLELKQLKEPGMGSVEYSRNFAPLSRLFIYWNERDMEGSVNEDAGAFIRDGLKVVASLGTPREQVWPYKIKDFKLRPTRDAFAEANLHRITDYARLSHNLDILRKCLADGFPFVFGFSVYDSFETAVVEHTGVVPMPGPGEQVLGGHAVCAVGYNDVTGMFIVRNSWGEKWGDHGYFYMPYAYLQNRGLSDDFWTAHK